MKAKIHLLFSASVVIAKSFEEAVEHAQKHASDSHGHVFIVGGSSIYERAVNSPYCAGVFLTEVSGNMKDGDVFFPLKSLRSSYTSANIDQIASHVIGESVKSLNFIDGAYQEKNYKYNFYFYHPNK